MTAHTCSQCGAANRIVNECRCDPHNLPTSVTPGPRLRDLGQWQRFKFTGISGEEFFYLGDGRYTADNGDDPHRSEGNPPVTLLSSLACCCCGEDAGQWAQHWNRDRGFGICRRCVEWVASRNRPEEDIPSLYGVEGVNYAPPEE